ncbi:MAG: hypothetical protein NTZ60_11630 [Campylobacterales bacterium]|nr:hypothetical protein [Campylobacterales bacterium]
MNISKDHPQTLIQFVKNNQGISKELDWVCKHASRTLLKKGHSAILELFNLQNLHHINIENFVCDKAIKIGDALHFSFELNAEPIENIRIEYAIEYLKANNRHNKKCL